MKNKPLSELVEEFLSEQDVSAASSRSYRIVINQFVRWVVINGIKFWEIKRADIIRYKSDLLKEKKSVNTLDLYLTVVRKLFKWLEHNGLYDNIAAGVHSPRKYRGHRKDYLRIEQVKELLNAIDTTTVIGKRNYAIVSLMVRAGIRRVEVCRMTVADVYNNNNTTVRLQRKGHVEKDTEIGITDKILEAIHDYLVYRDNLNDNSPLFVSHANGYRDLPISPLMISRIIKHYLKQIGIDDKRITGHSLRHTAAVLSLKAGATINEVQQMLGHTSIETTKIYLSAIDEETRLNNRAVHVLDELF